ncbi:MAG: putative sulfate exporter family transporter, partial [Tidjanibacter sp.]|nr:putative sulfate exporter family transporter [Tidjanibacter sp.]
MKKLLQTLKSEDWIIVFAGMVILAIALLFPNFMPSMPKSLATGANWLDAGYIFVFLLALTYITNFAMGRKLKGVLLSFASIFVLTLLAQMTAAIPFIKEIGLEAVFFAVIFGLIISNVFGVPEWMKPAIQSEFYIKIGIVCLGATILFGEVLHSGIYALIQALIVVFCVWYFAFYVSRKKFKVDDEMATMLASSVSICGVSAAIATAGAIKGDGKKLSYIISLVLVCAIPMMYLMPWIANLVLPLILSDPTAIQEVAGAWMGGTIDTTGAVVASGSLLGETAEQTAVIVKSSQNVLLGVAAFIISL